MDWTLITVTALFCVTVFAFYVLRNGGPKE